MWGDQKTVTSGDIQSPRQCGRTAGHLLDRGRVLLAWQTAHPHPAGKTVFESHSTKKEHDQSFPTAETRESPWIEGWHASLRPTPCFTGHSQTVKGRRENKASTLEFIETENGM